MNAPAKLGPVDFDLSRGRVERLTEATDGPSGGDRDHPRGGEQVVLIPVSALAALEDSAGPDAIKKLARAVGVSFGRRVSAKLGSPDQVQSASLESFVTALATEVAISGWGSLYLERWGRALVLVLEHGPLFSSGTYGALLEGALEEAAAREVHAVALPTTGREPGKARVLILAAKTAQDVRGWLADGLGESEVIKRLHERSQSTVVAPARGGVA